MVCIWCVYDTPDINNTMNKLHVLITAGPTQEAIDPVRYISNYSTGKIGYAFAERGAHVTLVIGPTQHTAQHPAINVVPVLFATHMSAAGQAYFPTATLTILAAEMDASIVF